MESVKDKYLKLPPGALGIFVVIFMIITGFVMYTYYMPAKTKNLQQAKKLYDAKFDQREKQKARLIQIQQNPIPEDRERLSEEHKQMLEDSLNTVTYEADREKLLIEIKKIATKAGGKNIEVTPGKTGHSYVEVVPVDGSYKLKTQPTSIRFQSNYSGVSNFLFQLRAMGHLLRIEKVDLNSEKYRGDVSAVIDVVLYFMEDEPAPEQASAGM